MKRRRRVTSSSMAVCSASWSISWDDDDDGEDRDLEKKTRDVSSMGWNRTRATREPALHQVGECDPATFTHHNWMRQRTRLGLPAD